MNQKTTIEKPIDLFHDYLQELLNINEDDKAMESKCSEPIISDFIDWLFKKDLLNVYLKNESEDED